VFSGNDRGAGVIGISMLTLNVEQAGGTLTYTRQLLRALGRVGELEYRVLLPAGTIGAEGGVPAVAVREFPAGRTRWSRTAAMARTLVAPGRLRAVVEAQGLDALHFPVGVMLPRVDSPPTATTIHDLQHEEFPEFFSRGQQAYRRRVYGWTIDRSRVLIAISEHVRGLLIERHGVYPERVVTIHHGIDHDLFSPRTDDRRPFLVYPANHWPHKNHDRLLEAVALVRRERPELGLVLTGVGLGGWSVPDWVDVRGRVSDEELVELYRTAAALVFPSLSEGFGLPPLEAMACGCPVAVSSAASLPEVCGDAAVYFDPTSVEDIARGIDDVLADPPMGGVEQAARFTWDECARRHDAVYRHLTG
jgi:glycosyltransferase involved in cell wall biosynthesis